MITDAGARLYATTGTQYWFMSSTGLVKRKRRETAVACQCLNRVSRDTCIPTATGLVTSRRGPLSNGLLAHLVSTSSVGYESDI